MSTELKSKLIIVTGKPEPDVPRQALESMKEKLEILINEHNNIVKDIKNMAKKIEDLGSAQSKKIGKNSK